MPHKVHSPFIVQRQGTFILRDTTVFPLAQELNLQLPESPIVLLQMLLTQSSSPGPVERTIVVGLQVQQQSNTTNDGKRASLQGADVKNSDACPGSLVRLALPKCNCYSLLRKYEDTSYLEKHQLNNERR